ncbi:MAG: hypothetical protein WCK47_01655 [bacterium]|nr:hypothetical protein [Candidatus Sumerlaeota bacterium]
MTVRTQQDRAWHSAARSKSMCGHSRIAACAKFQILCVIGILFGLLTGCGQKQLEPQAKTDLTQTGPPAYEIRDGKVFIPGWDDRPASAPRELLRIAPENFEKSVLIYRNRAVLTFGTIMTKPFTVPASATEVEFQVRATSMEMLFPRIEMSMCNEDIATSAPQVIFTGYLQSRTLQAYRCPLPPGWTGKRARVAITLLDHDRFYGRGMAFAYILFR